MLSLGPLLLDQLQQEEDGAFEDNERYALDLDEPSVLVFRVLHSFERSPLRSRDRFQKIFFSFDLHRYRYRRANHSNYRLPFLANIFG